MVDDEPDVIVGTRPVLTRRDKVAAAAAGLGCVAFALFLIDQQRWTHLVLMGVLLVVNVLRLLRPPTVVTQDGIRRPWRRQSFLPWASIGYVLQPNWVDHVQVVTVAGSTITVSGVAAALSDRVAAFGHKPVRPLQHPAPRPNSQERTQREIEADVARRAAALEAERRRMADSEKRWPRS